MGVSTISTFVVYKHGNYVGEGTPEYLSELTGLRPQTVRYLAFPSMKARYKPKWEVIPVENDQFVPKSTVDLDRLRELKKQEKYTFPELAPLIGTTASALKQKFSGRNRFKRSELEELEDIFYIKKGGLRLC